LAQAAAQVEVVTVALVELHRARMVQVLQRIMVLAAHRVQVEQLEQALIIQRVLEPNMAVVTPLRAVSVAEEVTDIMVVAAAWRLEAANRVAAAEEGLH
jgi:hypothetical protein